MTEEIKKKKLNTKKYEKKSNIKKTKKTETSIKEKLKNTENKLIISIN